MTKSNATPPTDFRVFDVRFPLPLHVSAENTQGHILMVSTLLFAQHGYAAVSIRDIAQAIDMTPASIYNHFGSKEVLWHAVLDHAKELYVLYFQELARALDGITRFDAALDVLCDEPIKMANDFTCYAFSLIQTAQLYSDKAAAIYHEVFLGESIDFVAGVFDRCIESGDVPPFDTRGMAISFMINVLAAIVMQTQKLMGRTVPRDPSDWVQQMRSQIIAIVKG